MSKGTTGRRPTESPADRLLGVADRLFYEQGYAATGVNELMKEAGVAKASFYHHFPSKTDLIVAYLEHRLDTWFAAVTKEVDQHADPARRVVALFDFLETWMVSCDFRGCAFLNTIPEFPDTSSAPRVLVRKAKQSLREFVGRLCTEAGRPEAGDEVFLLYEGATSQASAIGEVWPAQAARDAVRQKLQPINDN